MSKQEATSRAIGAVSPLTDRGNDEHEECGIPPILKVSLGHPKVQLALERLTAAEGAGSCEEMARQLIHQALYDRCPELQQFSDRIAEEHVRDLRESNRLVFED